MVNGPAGRLAKVHGAGSEDCEKGRNCPALGVFERPQSDQIQQFGVGWQEAPPHPPSPLRVARRPLPRTAGARWARLVDPRAWSGAPRPTPLPHHVGERSPWRLCRPAGEGGFPTPPNVERLESVWGWVPDVLGEPEEELGLLVAHPVAEGLQVYVHRVLTEVVENLQHQLHG